jgi:predicted unusual protein kinase regulating ubiquinone biosynthesis (AarF/ABC1/UbiB family)
MSNQSRIPSNRFNRMFRLGKLASGIAGSALQQGAKKVIMGERLVASDMLLTAANASRISSQLSEMRGAVMKIGQLLSMEAGDILPKELTDILGNLRDSAHSMPLPDLYGVLEDAWGENWQDMFTSFCEQPFAAASIGQVHEAIDRQGRHLAIKVQYPGIVKSIDSDVDNVSSLLRWFKLLPPELDIQPLLDAAKQQLHDEADYELEAKYLVKYRERIADDDVFRVPEVIHTLSTQNVLAMTFIEGESIEAVVKQHPELRNQLATRIIDLSLKEFLHWGMVQTDPNFANFRYNARDNTIGLLDFGALRFYDSGRLETFTELLRAALEQDLEKIVNAACVVGYIKKNDPFNYRMAIADLVQTAAEPAMHLGDYNFQNSSLSQRLSDKLFKLRSQNGFQRIPPADVIFLHRKLAGIYLLCANIKAHVDVRANIHDIFNLPPEPVSAVI